MQQLGPDLMEGIFEWSSDVDQAVSILIFCFRNRKRGLRFGFVLKK
jgi:hypothetical protein